MKSTTASYTIQFLIFHIGLLNKFLVGYIIQMALKSLATMEVLSENTLLEKYENSRTVEQ